MQCPVYVWLTNPIANPLALEASMDESCACFAFCGLKWTAKCQTRSTVSCSLYTVAQASHVSTFSSLWSDVLFVKLAKFSAAFFSISWLCLICGR